MDVNDKCGLAAEDSGRGTKRSIPDSECKEDSVVIPTCKKLRDVQPDTDLAGSREETSQSKEEHDLNFPLPWESGTPCLVKVGQLEE